MVVNYGSKQTKAPLRIAAFKIHPFDQQCFNVITQYLFAFNFIRFPGAYAFIEASSPRKRGHVARLISKPLLSRKSKCMTFFYHMMAAKAYMMGTFNVYIQRGISKKTLVFTKNSPQGSEWNKQSIQIPSSSTSFKVGRLGHLNKDRFLRQ